jgi:hypothetical protein
MTTSNTGHDATIDSEKRVPEARMLWAMTATMAGPDTEKRMGSPESYRPIEEGTKDEGNICILYGSDMED